MSRKRVYIAGPIVKGDLGENVGRAVSAFHDLIDAGLAPLCPHLSCYSGTVRRTWCGTPYALAEVLPRGTVAGQWYEVDLEWVAVSDAVLRLPGEGIGTDAECAFACARGIPVFYSVADVVEWAQMNTQQVS